MHVLCVDLVKVRVCVAAAAAAAGRSVLRSSCSFAVKRLTCVCGISVTEGRQSQPGSADLGRNWLLRVSSKPLISQVRSHVQWSISFEFIVPGSDRF